MGLVVAQFTLGVVSVSSILAVIPVSLHTLGAAALLAVLAHLTSLGFLRSSLPTQTESARETVSGTA